MTYTQSQNNTAASVFIVQVPEMFPKKWDLADTLPEGFEISILQGLLDTAAPYVPAGKNADYESLKVRAETMTRESAPDEISKLVQDMSGLDRVQRRFIMKIIKKQTGMPFETLKGALYDNKEKDETDHLDMARAVISEIGHENLLSTTAHVWLWENTGTWKTAPDRKLKQYVQNVVEAQGEAVSRGLVDSVTDVLKSEIFRPEHEWNLEQDAINVLNGELTWNGSEWILKSHCREHYLTTQVPHEYDQEAKAPRFAQFLQEIFAGDVDAAGKTRALLEMIGYTLTCHTRFERFVLLIGGGANGKSVVLDIIRLLVGRENVCAVQPSEFGNKFQRAHLHLKLANLVTEIREGAEIADAELKSIVSGELTTVEHKNKDPFDFRPYATCWFGTNHMPHTRDFSDALFRRALVMPFNNTFKAGINADPTLKDRLATELPGILNMALQAYGEALQRGSFTDPASCTNAKQEWRTEADQAAQFIGEMCTLEAGALILSFELYQAYQGWAKSAGITRLLNRKNFTTRILKCGGQKDRGTGGTRMIAGIRLNPTPSWKE
jgi:putative DNA primase/helicase